MKDKIKLITVAPYFYPKIGGLENYAYNISKGLMKDYNYEIVVITSNHENPKEYKEEILDGMKVYRLPRQFKISNTPISFKWKKQIKEIIEKEKPDVINAHTPVPFISDVACRVAHKKKIPFLLTYHAVTLYKKWSSLYNILILLQNIFLGYRTFNHSTKIIAVSDFVKKQFRDSIQKKTEIIYNSISKEELNKSNSKKEVDLIFLGNLDKAHSWKGLKEIILSIKKYKEKYGDISLWIAGDGDIREDYENLVKKYSLEDNIIFLGKKYGKEKNNIIKKSKSLITYPTTSNDAFPTVFLEAWANSVPVIVSNIGPTPYLIKDKEDGLLVEPNNPERLMEAIRQLLTDKNLQVKLANKGYKKVKENFTWDISIKKMNELLLGVLK